MAHLLPHTHAQTTVITAHLRRTVIKWSCRTYVLVIRTYVLNIDTILHTVVRIVLDPSQLDNFPNQSAKVRRHENEGRGKDQHTVNIRKTMEKKMV